MTTGGDVCSPGWPGILRITTASVTKAMILIGEVLPVRRVVEELRSAYQASRERMTRRLREAQVACCAGTGSRLVVD